MGKMRQKAVHFMIRLKGVVSLRIIFWSKGDLIHSDAVNKDEIKL